MDSSKTTDSSNSAVKIRLTFLAYWGAPARFVFPKLISWSEEELNGIKYFSGISSYTKTFTFKMPEDEKVIFPDLGKVDEVWLNDKPLGISWT